MKELVLFLTLFRIFAGPGLFFLILEPGGLIFAVFLFILASLSDYFDGLLARRYKVESSLGAILDPIADKILILFAFFAIAILSKSSFISFVCTLMLAREFWVSALREYAAQNNMKEETSVSFLSKIKTSIQFVAVSIFLIGFAYNKALVIFISSFLLFLALLISYKTAIDYSFNVFKASNKKV